MYYICVKNGNWRESSNNIHCVHYYHYLIYSYVTHPNACKHIIKHCFFINYAGNFSNCEVKIINLQEFACTILLLKYSYNFKKYHLWNNTTNQGLFSRNTIQLVKFEQKGLGRGVTTWRIFTVCCCAAVCPPISPNPTAGSKLSSSPILIADHDPISLSISAFAVTTGCYWGS